MKYSKFFAFITALVLIFSLCACDTTPAPSGHTDKDKLDTPTVGYTKSQDFSSDAGTSIDVLREELGQSTARFGMAYIGYFDAATAEKSGIDFGQWFYASSSAIAAYYPFISEIDEAHTVGSEGHLYCVIAKDYEASISVCRIGDDKPLYKAQNGDPILVFCNLDGDTQNADTVITVTTADGTEYRWEPTLDQTGYPNLLIGEERELLSWDFTATGDAGFDPEAWLADGWFGLTGGSLAGIGDGIDWCITTWDGSASYYLNFSPAGSGDYDGEIVMQCFYADGLSVQAQWQGWWRIETQVDQPSRLYIDMMLCNGTDKDAFAGSAMISESYRALIHPSGDYVLLVADDTVSTQNPIFPDGVLAVELTQASLLSVG